MSTEASTAATLTVSGEPPVTSVGIGSGTLDAQGVTAPVRNSLDFDPITDGTHTIRMQWSDDASAELQFRVFDLTDGVNLSNRVRGSNPAEWTGELQLDHEYRLFIKANSGTANYSVTLEAGIAFTLLAQPQDQSVTVGQNASFLVDATGSGDLNYQWFLANGEPVPGATDNRLTVIQATLEESGQQYYVQVSIGQESIDSDIATLTVTEPLALGSYSLTPDENAWTLEGPATTLDFNVGPNTDAWGKELLRVGNVLLVGGDFEGVKPKRGRGNELVIQPFLVALDAVEGTPLTSFNANIPWTIDRVVRALAVSPDGQTVYVGGDFGFVALDAITGELDESVSISVDNGSGVSGTQARIFDIAVTNSHIYIGGDFAKVEGQGGFRNVARLDLAGTLDQDWNPRFFDGFNNGRSARVHAVAVSPDEQRVYVGGTFERIEVDNVFTNVARTLADRPISMIVLNSSDGTVRDERFGVRTRLNTKSLKPHDIVVTDTHVFIAWGGPNWLSFSSADGDMLVDGEYDSLQQVRSKGDVQGLQLIGDRLYVAHHGEYLDTTADAFPPEAIVSQDPDVLDPYKFHSYIVDFDSGVLIRDQAWRITGPFGTWGIAAAPDSVWVAGQFSLAGTDSTPVEGLVRFAAESPMVEPPEAEPEPEQPVQ